MALLGWLLARRVWYGLAMVYRDFINWSSTRRSGAFVARVFAARVDPLLYRLTGGRLTSAGPQVIPQLVLTTVGRESGKRRRVQLGCLKKNGSFYVVA